jgi:SAM-dependent methyltransferase
MDDPEEFRAASRDHWEAAARGWSARREAFQAAAAPVSAWLVDAVQPQPGQTILELAAGPGDTGLLAAELVRPHGKLILTDGAEAMVEVARARTEELGLTDVVETRPMELEWIDLPTASVDAALCRWGYMLLADPEAALRETRRVLRPGGRVALSAWAAPEANPWSMGRVLLDQGVVEPRDPAEPGPFALADPDRIRELLQDAGFDEIVLDAVDFAFTAPDADGWWEHQLDCSPTLAESVRDLSPADHYRLRDAVDAFLTRFAQPDGSLRIPARTLTASATA